MAKRSRLYATTQHQMRSGADKRLDAEFLCSALALTDCPHWDRAEIAIAGRSNVGKSSILNALAGRKNLARISKMPGRTRCLNFFTVGSELSLVDLPGYGYAKISHLEASRIAELMQRYLRERLNLKCLILLVDARRGPEQEELALADFQNSRSSDSNLELIIVATKTDKLRNSERPAMLKRFTAAGFIPLMCSALSGEGIDELRRRIRRLASQAKKREFGIEKIR
jgi:GTP-binding protein